MAQWASKTSLKRFICSSRTFKWNVEVVRNCERTEGALWKNESKTPWKHSVTFGSSKATHHGQTSCNLFASASQLQSDSSHSHFSYACFLQTCSKLGPPQLSLPKQTRCSPSCLYLTDLSLLRKILCPGWAISPKKWQTHRIRRSPYGRRCVERPPERSGVP